MEEKLLQLEKKLRELLSPRVSDGPRCCYMDGHVILNTQGVLDSVVAPAKGIRTGCPDAPSDGFISHGEKEIYKSVGFFLGIKRLPGDPLSSSCEGALSSYEWLSETMVGDAAVRDRGKRLCRMIVGSDLLSLPLVFSFCRRYPFFFFGAVFGTYLFATAVPLVAFAGSLHLLSGLLGHCFGRVILLWLCGKKCSKKDCFVCPDLVNEEAAMPTEKGGKNAILFTKEQFNAGAPVPSAGVVQGIPPLLSNSPYLYSPQPCPGADGMQHHQHACVRSPALPSNGDRTARFDKGGAKGLVAVWGGWAGLSQHPSRPFSPNYTLKIPGLELRGHLVDWVEKASFACVCKLFEIDPKERAYKTLLSARNLTEVVREPQEYEAKEADAERRRKLLEDRDQKKTEGTIRKAPGQKRGPDSPPKKTSGKRGKLVKKHGKDAKEPTPPKEFPPPQTTYEGEVMIEEPVNAAPHSISSGPGRMSGLNHSGPSLVAAARLANVAEEAASINHPGNLNPDAAENGPVGGSGGRKAKSGLFERLQERQQEIEISCASAHDAHPDGGEVEMATETSAVPAIIPAEDASGPMCPDENMGAPIPGHELPSPSSSEEESADDAAPASPFSYAELEAKLKQITPDWKAIKPSAKVFDMIETGPRSMSQQHALFTQLLQTADYMRTFSSRHQEIENQLRLRMERLRPVYPPCERKMKPSGWSWLRQRVKKNQLRAAFMRRRVRQPG
ncbi:hypothetical protein CK203_011749 [Vitis vinifera]|uniref:Uncharacterized protein n=1 Tax=Vitis vinifera TaxID=29760 RepID=A0A438JTW2_VITVI|nr:hypothetical protein CK203_011749 [Vitis vinifera]